MSADSRGGEGAAWGGGRRDRTRAGGAISVRADGRDENRVRGAGDRKAAAMHARGSRSSHPPWPVSMSRHPASSRGISCAHRPLLVLARRIMSGVSP